MRKQAGWLQAGRWIQKNPAARQITGPTIRIGRRPSAASARTLMGFEDTDTTTEGTPGMETVLEPEWVGTRGGRGGPAACGEYATVPPGLVTAMCVFPFISSETSHIMGLSTSFINSGTEAKQKAQATLEV